MFLKYNILQLCMWKAVEAMASSQRLSGVYLIREAQESRGVEVRVPASLNLRPAPSFASWAIFQHGYLLPVVPTEASCMSVFPSLPPMRLQRYAFPFHLMREAAVVSQCSLSDSLLTAFIPAAFHSCDSAEPERSFSSANLIRPPMSLE
jgi:hypothetical protein